MTFGCPVMMMGYNFIIRQAHTMPILETSRLVLREFVPEDADALARVLSDPETMRYYPAPYDRGGVEQWIARNRQRYKDDGAGLWAMELKSSSCSADIAARAGSEGAGGTGTGMSAPHEPHFELIGDCGIILQQIEGERLYEIGYHLRRDCWGQGLATEAAIACREWAFAHLPADRLISLIRPENIASQRVAERNGMTIWKEIEWRELRHYVYSVQRTAERA